MTDNLPTLLRRRAKEQRNSEHARQLERAADELETRRHYQTEGERVTVQAVADARRMHAILVAVYNLVSKEPVNLEQLKLRAYQAQRVLKTVKETWGGRRILSVEAPQGTPREHVEHQLAIVLDHYYGTAAVPTVAPPAPIDPSTAKSGDPRDKRRFH